MTVRGARRASTPAPDLAGKGRKATDHAHQAGAAVAAALPGAWRACRAGRAQEAFLTAFREGAGDLSRRVPQSITQRLVDVLRRAGDAGSMHRHIDTLYGFAAAGFTEIPSPIHDDPSTSVRMTGERVLPALQ